MGFFIEFIGEIMIVAGTGHRPKYCPCLYDPNHEWLLKLKNNIKKELIDNKVTCVISGMALGWDTWLAQVALEMNIPVWAYIPFKGQEKKWPEISKKEYERIVKNAKYVKYFADAYIGKDLFLRRDKGMVDDADMIFSLLNPEVNSGGTFYTVGYAKEKDKKIINFWF